MPVRVLKDSRISVSNGLVLRVDKEITKAVQKQLERGCKTKIGRLVKDSHVRLYRSIGDVLAKGVTPLGGGSKNIKFEDSSKSSYGTFKTQSWEALTPKYAKKDPRSTTFWTKHHGVSQYRHNGLNTSGVGKFGVMRPTLNAMYKGAKLTRNTASVKSSRTRKVRSTPKAKEFTWNLYVSVPDNALGMYISGPMLRGLGGAKSLGAHPLVPRYSSHETIAMIGYVEGRRPFLRGVSLKAGRSLRVAIRRQMSLCAS